VIWKYYQFAVYGVYLYLFVTRTTDGREVRSSVGKIAVRR
jgi:hypothetical protein